MLDKFLEPVYNGCRETADKPVIGITTNAGGEDFLSASVIVSKWSVPEECPCSFPQ